MARRRPETPEPFVTDTPARPLPARRTGPGEPGDQDHTDSYPFGSAVLSGR
jgi:hypothetical protein